MSSKPMKSPDPVEMARAGKAIPQDAAFVGPLPYRPLAPTLSLP
jgi:hypothetical protein